MTRLSQSEVVPGEIVEGSPSRALSLVPNSRSVGSRPHLAGGAVTRATAGQDDLYPDFAVTLAEANRRVQLMKEFVREHMVEGEDFGVIPGASPKPTLFKAGAEKLNAIFGLAPLVEVTERKEDWVKGFVAYGVKVTLVSKRSGTIEAEGVGHCNSRERKYKSQDAANVANTVLKMAKKRALIDATLSATRASGLFRSDDGSVLPQQQRPQGQRNEGQRPHEQRPHEQRPHEQHPHKQHPYEQRNVDRRPSAPPRQATPNDGLASEGQLSAIKSLAARRYGVDWPQQIAAFSGMDDLATLRAEEATRLIHALQEKPQGAQDGTAAEAAAAAESSSARGSSNASSVPASVGGWNGENESPGKQREARQQARRDTPEGRAASVRDTVARIDAAAAASAAPTSSGQAPLIYEIPQGTSRKQCQGCKATIVFVPTKNDKLMPLNLDRTAHWINCPASNRFKAPSVPAQTARVSALFATATDKGLDVSEGARQARIDATNAHLLDCDKHPVNSWSELGEERAGVVRDGLKSGKLTWDNRDGN